MYAIKYALKKLRDFCIFIATNATLKPPQKIEDSIIILRSDAIGDYLLFRNFLSEIRVAYPKHRITLLGNIAWRDLSLHFDRESVDDFVFFSARALSRNPLYAINFLKTLKSKQYSIFINSVHSRDNINFLLANNITATSRIAPQGDCINATPRAKAKSDRIYTTIYPSKSGVIFEFYRNMEFFCNLLDKKLSTKLELDSSKLVDFKSLQERFALKTPYSILFIGASSAFRKWSIESFAKVGAHLMQKYGQNIAICGGKDDMANAKILQIALESSHRRVFNLAGITSLLELASTVYNGNHLITNETSCAHLGAILRATNVFVVSNGNHLGRFIPYPRELRDKYYPVFHHFINDNIEKYEELSNAYAYKSTLNIDEIAPKTVIDMIDLHIKEQK